MADNKKPTKEPAPLIIEPSEGFRLVEEDGVCLSTRDFLEVVRAVHAESWRPGNKDRDRVQEG